MANFKYGSLILSQNVESLSSTKILEYNSPQLQFLNPSTTVQDVYLPTVTQCNGLPFWITNTNSDNNLNVYDDTTTLITTIVPNDVVVFLCNGVMWKADIEQTTPVGSSERTVTTKTSDYNMSDSDDVILVDASSSDIQIKLPDPTVSSLKDRDIKKIDSSSHIVTIVPYSTETIDGGSSITLQYQNMSFTIITNNINWYAL